jgi:hypothetical protein
MPKIVWGILSLACLAVCLISAVLHFAAKLRAPDFKLVFLVASIGWFVFAALWARARKA